MYEEALRYAKGQRELLKVHVLQIGAQSFHLLKTGHSGQYSD
jgi:hypothetical protein